MKIQTKPKEWNIDQALDKCKDFLKPHTDEE